MERDYTRSQDQKVTEFAEMRLLASMYLKVSKKVKRWLNDQLLEEVKHMRVTFSLSKRLVDMERQCWTNAQYSRRECLEVMSIPQSVKDHDLNNAVTQVANKIGVNICERNMQAFFTSVKGICRLFIAFAKKVRRQ